MHARLTIDARANRPSFPQPSGRHSGPGAVLNSKGHAHLQKPQHRSSRRCPRKRDARQCCSAQLGFHQQRLAADVRTGEKSADFKPLAVEIREARTDSELCAIGWLRAQSFYAYPPERAFAGQLHQTMKADEEYKALKAEGARRASMSPEQMSIERSACLAAVASQKQTVTQPEGIVGTLDLYAVRALKGEVLIGDSKNAAYLANVCVADSARRQGVGGALIEAARQRARAWGVDDLYVHIMAVNEGAKLFYNLHGFTTEQEESSNSAHYRGHCLDGIEGRGRTILLKDTLL